MKAEIEFFKFKDREPKLTYEDTLMTDDDKGVNVYTSTLILVGYKGDLFLGKMKKVISNYDNKVEELYIDLEVALEPEDRRIEDTYIVPTTEMMWAYASGIQLD